MTNTLSYSGAQSRPLTGQDGYNTLHYECAIATQLLIIIDLSFSL